MSTDWQSKAKAKREAILESIPKEWRLDKIPSAEEQKDITAPYINQFLSKREIEITETDAYGIAEHTTTGEWSAVEVIKAFCHRAALAHQLVNCLHETFFDAAVRHAQICDDFFNEHKMPIGPLHGVPVSLKDQFHVKDVETTMGYVGWIGTFQGQKDDPRAGTLESEMVQELRNLGAILYCKTAVPHTLMCGETINNIIEYTWNPKNRLLSSGGSSGGEGALIGIRGSPLGIGTDIGGSIRIPAAFNGLYGLRPTAGRLPYEGMANSMDGQNSVLSVVGPIATTARSLTLFTKSILSQDPWNHDPQVVRLPWSEADEQETKTQIESKSGLCFGVIRNDGVVSVQPPVARAVQMLVDAAQKAGHKVIEWQGPAAKRINDITANTWLYDGGKDIKGAFALSGEPQAEQLHRVYGGEIEEWTGSRIAGNNIDKRTYQKEYLDYWNSTVSETGTGRPVDGLICPLAPFAAARPDHYRYYGYSMWVNGLDYPSVVVPVTNVDKNIDTVDGEYKPISDLDKFHHEDYDPEVYDGAHVGVQIVGKRYQEEKLLAIAEHVGKLLGK